MTDTTAHAGKVALVTGAGRGIGRAMALAYGRAGARVAVLDMLTENAQETVSMIRELGGTAKSATADISDFAALDEAHTALTDALGPVDVLINNAGISPKTEGVRVEIKDMDPAEWNHVVGVNLTGSFNAARLVVPGMIEAGGGAIINMSSVAGKAYLDMVAVHYSATKAAIIGFTRHLAGELGRYRITANALSPGRIETDMMRMVAPEVNEVIRQETALQRFGQPDDVAAVALFLSSPAGSFVTGQTIDVAGGWHLT